MAKSRLLLIAAVEVVVLTGTAAGGGLGRRGRGVVGIGGVVTPPSVAGVDLLAEANVGPVAAHEVERAGPEGSGGGRHGEAAGAKQRLPVGRSAGARHGVAERNEGLAGAGVVVALLGGGRGRPLVPAAREATTRSHGRPAGGGGPRRLGRGRRPGERLGLHAARSAGVLGELPLHLERVAPEKGVVLSASVSTNLASHWCSMCETYKVLDRLVRRVSPGELHKRENVDACMSVSTLGKSPAKGQMD